MPRVLVINGPNLNLQGKREVGIYGDKSLEDINRDLSQEAARLGIDVDFFQSNHEGDLIDKIHDANSRYGAIIINAGALTHYSIALHDALQAAKIPVIEVHMSNIYRREEFRRQSYISPAAAGGIFGFGPLSYQLALRAAAQILKEESK